MASTYIPRAEYIRRHGEVAYRAYCAGRSAKKARTRARARLRRLGDAAPTDPIAARRVMYAHPTDCLCRDCLYGADDAWQPVVARWPDRVRL